MITTMSLTPSDTARKRTKACATVRRTVLTSTDSSWWWLVRIANVAHSQVCRESVNFRLRSQRTRLQEVEVAALVRLPDVLQIQSAVTAAVLRRRLLPAGSALV